jgi:membrane glycosyltransferase
VQRFGGALRFSFSAALEIIFAFLQGAISTIRTSLFMLGLLFGKSILWNGQRRDSAGISWRAAFAALWPQLVFGLAVCGGLYATSPATLYWSLPLTAGYLLAIPFTVATAAPGVGRYMQRAGLAGIPEDFNPPLEIRNVQRVQSN